MNKQELEKIKQKALEEHIPIIMDDTWEVVDQILKEVKPQRILEIGTAVGYSASMFAKSTDEDCIIDTIEIDEERAKASLVLKGDVFQTMFPGFIILNDEEQFDYNVKPENLFRP